MAPVLKDMIQRKDINKVLSKIFYYDNYRNFLKEYFQEMKNIKNFFSHRYFAQKAGFSSSSFAAHVMEGKRNLTEKSLEKMLKGLGVEGKEARYFKELVRYNQSKELQEREKHFTELERIRKSTQFYQINKKQFAFYDHWYYPVIRELATHFDWKGDFSVLAKKLRPKITTEEARKAVHVLVDIGLLKKENDGNYSQNSEIIIGDNIPSFAVKKARKEQLLRAIESAETMGPEERHISSLTVAMSKKTFQYLSEEMDRVRRKVLEEILNDEEVDGIYQLGFQIFPVSNSLQREVK